MKDETVVLNKFKLDRFSPLTEDGILLNLDIAKYRELKGTLVQATILGLFENKKELIVFMYVPMAGQTLTEMVINQKRYQLQLNEEDKFVHKYSIPFAFKPGKLDVTEYVFTDNSLTRSTYSVKEEHVFGVLNDQYFYDSKKYYQTQLIGELFHDVIDMTTVKDKFQDLLGRPLFYRDISSLKSKQIKLYYVAFNLFDQKQSRYFFPDTIVEMKVQYQESRYVYQAKNLPLDSKIDPSVEGETFIQEKKETIQKELRKIESGEKSDWNIITNFFTYKQYRYQAIYQINDVVKTKHLQQQNYSYVLVIGPKHGYRLSNETLSRPKGLSYDVEDTKLSQIKIYHVTYQQKGHRYAVPVQSLVYESDKKSRLPRVKHRIKRFFQSLATIIKTPFKFVFGAGGLLIKIIKWIVTHWKLIVILVILGLLTYLGLQIARFFAWI
jgi:hypothetical protein